MSEEEAGEAIGREEPLSGFVGILDRLGGALLEPGKTFDRMIDEERGILEPLLIVVVFNAIQGAIIGSLIVRIILSVVAFAGRFFGQMGIPTGGVPPGPIPMGLLAIIPVATAVLWSIAALILWVIFAGIAHFIAKYVFKGVGSFVRLLTLYGYASVPWSLVILGMVLLGLNLFAFMGFSAILNLVAIFWMVLITVVAAERSHKIDPGKAFISVFIGPLVVFLILFAIGGPLASLALGGMFG